MKDKFGAELKIDDYVRFYFLMDDSDYIGQVASPGNEVRSSMNKESLIRIAFRGNSVWRDNAEVERISEEECMIWKLLQ